MRHAALALVGSLWCVVFIAAAAATGSDQAQTPGGWKIPAGAELEKNPLPVNDALFAAGKSQFAKRCARCHGELGKGDGPDAPSDHAEHMDLTSAAGAARNPDGVVFYKIWHGRTEPRMPAFEDQLSKEQAWAIVAYVQTLRQKR
jgi:mono/diheme cytochrome c family protein